MTDLRFLGLVVYSSLTLIGTIICSPLGYLTRAPDSSILRTFLPFVILYSVSVSWYSLN